MNAKKLLSHNMRHAINERIALDSIEQRRAMLSVITQNIKLFVQIHAEIQPQIDKMILADKIFSSVGHCEGIAAVSNWRQGKQSNYFYGTGSIDQSDLASENEPVYAAIKTIRAVNRI